jgi:hypothetical protein
MSPANEIRISASVGRNGVNRSDDVSTIQQLINDHLPAALQPLKVMLDRCVAITGLYQIVKCTITTTIYDAALMRYL